MEEFENSRWVCETPKDQALALPRTFSHEALPSFETGFSRPDGKAVVGLRPVFFGPCTPWRTWGTRPISSGVCEASIDNA